MGFNLKKILLALLFSTSDPLSIKDIQAVITRYHADREARAARKSADEQELSDVPSDVETADGTSSYNPHCYANP